MNKRKLLGAGLPLLLMVVVLVAGCGGSTSPTAPVEAIGSTAPPSPMPISPAGDEGPGIGNDNRGQATSPAPARGPQVAPVDD